MPASKKFNSLGVTASALAPSHACGIVLQLKISHLQFFASVLDRRYNTTTNVAKVVKFQLHLHLPSNTCIIHLSCTT